MSWESRTSHDGQVVPTLAEFDSARLEVELAAAACFRNARPGLVTRCC